MDPKEMHDGGVENFREDVHQWLSEAGWRLARIVQVSRNYYRDGGIPEATMDFVERVHGLWGDVTSLREYVEENPLPSSREAQDG